MSTDDVAREASSGAVVGSGAASHPLRIGRKLFEPIGLSRLVVSPDSVLPFIVHELASSGLLSLVLHLPRHVCRFAPGMT